MNKALLKLIAGKLAAMIGGPLVWLWSKILYYGGRYLYDFACDLIRKIKRASVQKEKKEVLDKVDADPKSTDDDVAKAYADYLNSGRKK